MSEQTDIETLKQTLATTSDWRQKTKALHGLADMGSSDARDAIVGALFDENPHVGEYAAQILFEFGPDVVLQLTAALERADERVLPTMLNTLRQIGDPSALPAMEKLIDHPDGHVSGTALCYFCEIAPRDQAIPYLLKGLQSENHSVQNRCCELIAPLQVEEAIPYLRSIVLKNDNFTPLMAGRSAALALGKLGSLGLDILLEASRHDDYRICDNATAALGESDDPKAFGRLVELLQDENHMIATSAVIGLEKLNHPDAYELLLPLLDRPGVGYAARDALGKTGDLRAIPILMERLRKQEHNADSGLYYLCHRYWGTKPLEVDAADMPKVMTAAQNDLDVRVRIIAILALQSFGYEYHRLREVWLATHHTLEGLNVPDIYLEARDLLVALLDEQNADIRSCVLIALSSLADEYAIPRVIDCLLDEDDWVSLQATELLGHMAYFLHYDINAAAPNLIKLLERSDDALRRAAISQLGGLGDEVAITALLRLVSNESDPHRDTVITMLGNVPPERVVPLLLDLLNDDTSPAIQESAAIMLDCLLRRHRGTIQDKRIVVAFTRLLNSVGSNPQTTYKIRQWAALALAQLNDESTIPALMSAIDHAPEWQIKMHAVDALGGIGDHRSAADRLYPLLEHENSLVRTVAANRLGFVGTGSDDEELRAEIVEKLIPKLYDDGKGHMLRPTVAIGAAKSLYFIGTTRALDALKERAAREKK